MLSLLLLIVVENPLRLNHSGVWFCVDKLKFVTYGLASLASGVTESKIDLSDTLASDWSCYIWLRQVSPGLVLAKHLDSIRVACGCGIKHNQQP